MRPDAASNLSAIVTSVVAGAVLGVAAAWRAVFSDIVIMISLAFGAVVGLLLSPLPMLITRERDTLVCWAAVLAPTAIVALITSSRDNPATPFGLTVSVYLFLWTMVGLVGLGRRAPGA